MKARKHTYFWVCPYCGANLDPGEVCDCRLQKDKPARNKSRNERIVRYEKAN